MKICKKCGLEKNKELFRKDKSMKEGIKNICIECDKIRNKQWRDKNKEKISEKNKQWNASNKDYYIKYREDNKERLNDYNTLYREDNKEKISNYKKEYQKTEEYKIKHRKSSKKYRENNKEKIKNYYESIKDDKKVYRETNKERIKEYSRDYMRERKKTDPLFKMKCNLRTTLYLALNKIGYKKDSNTENIIGCSYDYFIEHIENQFESWMNWDNHGLYETDRYNIGWDIDHIIPLNTANTIEEIYILFHYTNLRPLCSKLNRDIKKGNY